MKKALLKTIYNLGGFTPFHWANHDKNLVLMYHRFGRKEHPHKTSATEFTAHLEYLKKHNHVLSLAEMVDFLQNGKSLPSNSVAITIDDGYADTYEIAFPILKEFGFPATLFAVTDFLDEKCWLWTDFMRYVLTQTTENFCSVEFENCDKVETGLTDEMQSRKPLDASIHASNICRTNKKKRKSKKLPKH